MVTFLVVDVIVALVVSILHPLVALILYAFAKPLIDGNSDYNLSVESFKTVFAFDSGYGVVNTLLRIFQYAGITVMIVIFFITLWAYFFGSTIERRDSLAELIIRPVITIFLIYTLVLPEPVEKTIITPVGSHGINKQTYSFEGLLPTVIDLGEAFYKKYIAEETWLTEAPKMALADIEEYKGEKLDGITGDVSVMIFNTLLYPVVGLILLFVITSNMLKLILESMKRFVNICVLYCMCPFVCGFYISANTQNIFFSYIRMFGAEIIMFIFTKMWVFVCYKFMLHRTGMFNGGGILTDIFLIALIQLGVNIDALLQRLGFNTSNTGGALLDNIGRSVFMMSSMAKLGAGVHTAAFTTAGKAMSKLTGSIAFAQVANVATGKGASTSEAVKLLSSPNKLLSINPLNNIQENYKNGKNLIQDMLNEGKNGVSTLQGMISNLTPQDKEKLFNMQAVKDIFAKGSESNIAEMLKQSAGISDATKLDIAKQLPISNILTENGLLKKPFQDFYKGMNEVSKTALLQTPALNTMANGTKEQKAEYLGLLSGLNEKAKLDGLKAMSTNALRDTLRGKGADKKALQGVFDNLGESDRAKIIKAPSYFNMIKGSQKDRAAISGLFNTLNENDQKAILSPLNEKEQLEHIITEGEPLSQETVFALNDFSGESEEKYGDSLDALVEKKGIELEKTGINSDGSFNAIAHEYTEIGTLNDDNTFEPIEGSRDDFEIADPNELSGILSEEPQEGMANIELNDGTYFSVKAEPKESFEYQLKEDDLEKTSWSALKECGIDTQDFKNIDLVDNSDGTGEKVPIENGNYSIRKDVDDTSAYMYYGDVRLGRQNDKPESGGNLLTSYPEDKDVESIVLRSLSDGGTLQSLGYSRGENLDLEINRDKDTNIIQDISVKLNYGDKQIKTHIKPSIARSDYSAPLKKHGSFYDRDLFGKNTIWEEREMPTRNTQKKQ